MGNLGKNRKKFFGFGYCFIIADAGSYALLCSGYCRSRWSECKR